MAACSPHVVFSALFRTRTPSMHPRPMSNKVKNAMPSLTFVRVAQSMANLCVDDPANGKVGNRGQWCTRDWM